MIEPATATLLASLFASAPGIAQTLVGGAQGRQARRFGANLVRPDMPIPEASVDALETARSLASGLQMPGYENTINEIMQIMGGAGYQVDQAATTSSQALGAITQASGQQMNLLNRLAGEAARDYTNRQLTYKDALEMMGKLQNEQWFQNIFGAYQEKSDASASLGGAEWMNKYGGISDIFGSLAAAMPMLAKSGTGDPASGGGGNNVAGLMAAIAAMGNKSAPGAPELPKSITTPNGEMALTPEQAAVLIPGAATDYGSKSAEIFYPAKPMQPSSANNLASIITGQIAAPGLMGSGAQSVGPEIEPPAFGSGMMSESNSMYNLDPSFFETLRQALGIK